MENYEYKKRLLEVSEKQTDKESSWFQIIITIAAALLGLLVSLHEKPCVCEDAFLLYAATLSTIALGILTGATWLYSVPHTLNRLRKRYAALGYKVLLYKKVPDIVVAPKPIFLMFRSVSLVCFAVSIPLLVLYALIL